LFGKSNSDVREVSMPICRQPTVVGPILLRLNGRAATLDWTFRLNTLRPLSGLLSIEIRAMLAT
jgi:hypothetical protein